jgi:predicted secreted protein
MGSDMEVHIVSIFEMSVPCLLLFYLTWLWKQHDLPKRQYTLPEYMALVQKIENFIAQDKYEMK